MARKLFCEISPLTYAISVKKMRMQRRIKDFLGKNKFAKGQRAPLPVLIYKHSLLIRRKLGNVDMQLQENKATNLQLAAPKVTGVVINPGEVFSFWRLVGACTARKGYKTGLTIAKGAPAQDVGGGMCQFTNMLHWLVLHSPITITEHHHHDGVDMFPDYGRKVPFGCGTSIMYNYLDYRFKNNTNTAFQLVVYTTDTHLCGELRAAQALEQSFHICEEDGHFAQVDGVYYRRNKIVRRVVDKATGNELERAVIKTANAKVLYDAALINQDLIRT